MGMRWVGTTSVPKPQPGSRLERTLTVDTVLPADQALSLLTSRQGVSTWLGGVTSFDGRRGGTVTFMAGYTGSFSLIDIPGHVVLATERHGEIDVHLDVARDPVHVQVTVTRFVLDSEDRDEVVAGIEEMLASLEGCLSGQGQAHHL